jgi:hypothetical protein
MHLTVLVLTSAHVHNCMHVIVYVCRLCVSFMCVDVCQAHARQTVNATVLPV